jgi:hypothetical protein
MNVNPTPAQAVVVDLQTLVPETFSFLEACSTDDKRGNSAKKEKKLLFYRP